MTPEPPATLRESARRQYPDFPWLEPGDPAGIEAFLRLRGWLADGEHVESCEPAGAGNMNLTLRIETPRRLLLFKQARPWVEKYDHIPAPWNRSESERRFYELVQGIPFVSERMPRLLASDPPSHTLLLEWIDGDGDYSDLYDPASDRGLTEPELGRAADVLAHLHRGSSGGAEPALSNREMRALNHAHLFEVPLDPKNGLDLDAQEPGLADAARSLIGDADYREKIRFAASDYLQDGRCLLHGDYFPGSWLRGRDGLILIDPEFCFRGAPEIDVGCAIAHFALSRRPEATALAFIERYAETWPNANLDHERVARFAGVETMRRLIGVAQLPIPQTANGDGGLRVRLLERSREAMRRLDWRALWS